MSDFSWLNTSFSDFDSLLSESELVEEPVPIDVFMHDKFYLGIKRASDLQKKIIERSSQILLPHTLAELYGEERAREIWEEETVSEIIAQCGKGSGKDFSARCAFLYTIYKLHCLRDPLAYYGKAHGTYIDLLNLAVNAEQAERVFFSPLKNMMTGSPYFQEMGFELRKKEVEFLQRPIRLFSGNSESEAWEGLDLMLVVLDEIAAFKTDGQLQGERAQRLSASAIYKMSKLSVMSRFPDVGKCILLSFPRYRDDFIQQRYDESETEPKVLRIKAKTWEMNPLITREQLEPEYARNPIDAKARFECEPPEMIDAFFRDPERVRACFQGQWVIRNEGKPDERRILTEIDSLNPVNDDGTFKPWFKPSQGDEFTRFIHCDLALKRDRAAVAMCHVPGTRRIETGFGQHEQLPVVKMDLIHYWEAMPGQDIDFSGIREFIALLCKKFPVGLVTFDQWNSVDMIQSLNRRGIYSEMQSVKINHYDNLATCFYDGRFSGYFNHILVEDELLKLQVLENRKVDHPSKGYKDGSDALAGATWSACQYADIDTEIELDIIGTDEDWEDYEMADALEDDKQRDGRYGKDKSSLVEIDFEIESI